MHSWDFMWFLNTGSLLVVSLKVVRSLQKHLIYCPYCKQHVEQIKSSRYFHEKLFFLCAQCQLALEFALTQT